MNEKILGLSLECAARAEEYADVEYAKRQTGYCRQDFFNYKLVELIVQECIQVCGPEDSYTDEWFKAKADSVAKIKQHFGVEE